MLFRPTIPDAEISLSIVPPESVIYGTRTVRAFAKTWPTLTAKRVPSSLHLPILQISGPFQILILAMSDLVATVTKSKPWAPTMVNMTLTYPAPVPFPSPFPFGFVSTTLVQIHRHLLASQSTRQAFLDVLREIKLLHPDLADHTDVTMPQLESYFRDDFPEVRFGAYRDKPRWGQVEKGPGDTSGNSIGILYALAVGPDLLVSALQSAYLVPTDSALPRQDANTLSYHLSPFTLRTLLLGTCLHELCHGVVKKFYGREIMTPLQAGRPDGEGNGDAGWRLEGRLLGAGLVVEWDRSEGGNLTKACRLIGDVEKSQYYICTSRSAAGP